MSHEALSVGGDALVAAYSIVPRPGDSMSADDAKAPRVRPVAAAIAVELAEGDRLGALNGYWRDLLVRADAPNVFMAPALIKLAGEAYPDKRPVALLAWQTADARPRLVGVWGFAIGRAPQSILPIDVLTAPPMAHAYLATPVIDRGLLDETLTAMLDFIVSEPGLPKIVALDAMTSDDLTMQALTRVLAARGGAPCVLAEAKRPKLASALDGKRYLEQALSSSSRKKLRQHRRRLAEKGALESRVVTAPDAIAAALEQFLALEAAGWKGRQGTALLSNPTDAAYARAMVIALAQRGEAAIHMLTLDGRPISMQIVLRAGPVAFTWKTAYDETWRDASPGMLLLEDYTAAFLADDSIAYVDSCAYDETSFMAAWSERQAIANLWFDARPGRPLSFTVLGHLQGAYTALRDAAKRAYRKHARTAR